MDGGNRAGYAEIPGTISIIKESADPMSDDMGVTNVDLKKFLDNYEAFPSTATKAEPLYVNIGPKQNGNEPANAGEGLIFVSDGVSSISIEVHILCSLLMFYSSHTHNIIGPQRSCRDRSNRENGSQGCGV